MRDIEVALFSNKPATQDFSRTERRYLTATPEQQWRILGRWATFTNGYRVRTLYLDTPEGTWSRGHGRSKVRLRNYNGERDWWVEVKPNSTGQVTKHRRIVQAQDRDILEQLVPVAGVSYFRTEFEDDRSPLRVTLDRKVTFWQVPRNLQMAMGGEGVPVDKLPAQVLETKSTQEMPGWLPLPRRWNGSKSRTALVVLWTQ